MKAAAMYEYGGLDVLKYGEIETPRLGPRDVLVKVRATGLNYFDIMVRDGRYRANPSFPHVLGEDISGEVAEVGAEVTGWTPGQPVLVYAAVGCGQCEQCLKGEVNICIRYRYFGAHLWGGYAQYARVPAANLIALPAGVGYEEAAAFPVTFLTSWHMLVTRANVRPGEDVLIHAAGSGVGIAGVQIAKLCGARVIATAGTDEKLDRARELGADEVINYRKQDFYEEVRRITGKRGVDVVFEHIGTDVWDKSVRCLTRGGRLVTCGGTSGYQVTTDVAYIFHKQLQIIGSNHGTKPELETLVKLLEARKLRSVVDKVYPLKEAQEAQAYLEERKNFGKVLLVPEP
ncbi:MAG: zinc-binding dehydrogenase [Deltaproteobacteria bacterium]|nr:zinc-binding dehydrogenase [Deltaproteobacteria bacterium]MBI3076964.1 zinc-binding dehydrogenase [Deltaproteobacteria bacterium]